MSLVMGVNTLRGYYQDWSDKQAAISELVAAAGLLADVGSYHQAWKMYLEASDLSSGSTVVRKAQYSMALEWIRHFSAPKPEAGELLDQMTVVLFRSMIKTPSQERAVILAHVARLQWLRHEYDVPVFLSSSEMLDRALALSENDLYANTWRASLYLMQRPISAEDIDAAQHHYGVALEQGEKRDWIRAQQLELLGEIAVNRSLGNRGMQALLQTAIEMMKNDEPKPPPTLRRRLLDGYGHMGSGEYVEDLVNKLPPQDHLAVIHWLRQGLDYYSDRASGYPAQQDFLEARLLELTGETQRALEIYRKLYESDSTYRKLNPLVDAAIVRVTGQQTERMQQRKYINDPVDETSPWAFHLDTLQHFDPKWMPDNFDQAIEYFERAVSEKDARLPELAQRLPEVMQRIMQTIREGEQIAAVDGWTSGYSVGHFDYARRNWSEAGLLYAEVLLATGENDKALAVLADVRQLSGQLPDAYADELLFAQYLTALVYADDAIKVTSPSQRKNSVTLALKFLIESVEAGLIQSGMVDWDEIKSNSFSALSDNPAYQELIRGR